MKDIIKKITTTSLIVMSLSSIIFLSAPTTPAFADAKSEVCNAIGVGAGRPCENGESRITRIIATVINLLSAIGGIIAVILIIIGGVKYMTSGGDSNSAANARNTILYAIVGLIIVVFAQVIVRFVLQQV